MNNAERDKIVKLLETAGFTDHQVKDFLLALDDKISMEEFKKRFSYEKEVLV